MNGKERKILSLLKKTESNMHQCYKKCEQSFQQDVFFSNCSIAGMLVGFGEQKDTEELSIAMNVLFSTLQQVLI